MDGVWRALRATAMVGALLVASAVHAAAASPAPSSGPWPAGDRALAAVRAVDPRFADLPDYADAWRHAATEFDLAPVLAGSWVHVLPTFQQMGMAWMDLGQGLLVEVMLVDGCPTTLTGVGIGGSGDPCAWRHSWVYHVLPTGEARLVSDGGSPDPEAP